MGYTFSFIKDNGQKKTDPRTFVVGEIGKQSLSPDEIDKRLTPFLVKKTEKRNRPSRYVSAHRSAASGLVRELYSICNY